jgi:hypothetical protein
MNNIDIILSDLREKRMAIISSADKEQRPYLEAIERLIKIYELFKDFDELIKITSDLYK